MKKLLFSSVLLFAIGCQSNEKTPQEIKEDYIAKGQKYLDVKVSKDIEKEDGIANVKIQKVDSIVPLSTYGVEQIKMLPLINEYTKQVNFATKISEIDQMIGDTYTPSTMAEIKKAGMLEDSLSSWQLRSESLQKKDTLSYQVYFKAELTKKDGSKLKETPISLVFDKEGDIDGRLMDLIFP